jgi:lipoprotein signal peptidase
MVERDKASNNYMPYSVPVSHDLFTNWFIVPISNPSKMVVLLSKMTSFTMFYNYRVGFTVFTTKNGGLPRAIFPEQPQQPY